ncbi:hypothetical protein R69919_04989 [Paraburkholderia gardini]|jgi:hypothetical protein|uniref:Lipoprotein n=2 Tax=Paraburkholderia gardini TaxID=2823469 RepID=A0ABN7QP99_9BURK|nr:hypothetical protein R54767_04221 [Paraburkholderia gardini]CAG4922297.1 hypothetical protein R69919_04989 [Paraburkholderia gardini]
MKRSTLLHAAKADGHAARRTDDVAGADIDFHPRRGRGMLMRSCVLMALCAGLTGCGLAAAPCRIASAGLKIVPVVGHVAAAPTDACADVIDP